MKVQDVKDLKIANVTDDLVQEIFAEFDECDINDWGCEPQYLNEENEKYKITSEIDRYGGEGCGDEYWMISEVLNKETQETFYISFYGYYESWNGVEMQGWNVVKPNVVEVIQWF